MTRCNFQSYRRPCSVTSKTDVTSSNTVLGDLTRRPRPRRTETVKETTREFSQRRTSLWCATFDSHSENIHSPSEQQGKRTSFGAQQKGVLILLRDTLPTVSSASSQPDKPPVSNKGQKLRLQHPTLRLGNSESDPASRSQMISRPGSSRRPSGRKVSH